MYDSFKLKEEFISSFSTIKPKFGFNGLGELTFFRTYSRLKSNGKNEQYFETVERVVNTIYSIQKEWILQNRLYWNEDKAQNSAQEMYRRIFEFKFTPAGRGFWSLVPKLLEQKGGGALNNCFDGNTEFLTDLGIKKLKDCEETYVNVFTRLGKFVPAKVKNYGKQSLNKIILRPLGLRSNLKLDYVATSNHRWVLENGNITENLKLNDIILGNPVNITVDKNSEDYINGFTHGLIFGDGTRVKKYPNRHYIKICDGDSDVYRPYLSKHKGFRSETKGKDGYPIFTIISDINLKELPINNQNYIYLRAFIEGWMCADSYLKYRSNTWCLDTQSKEASDWVIKNASYAGLCVTGISIENRDPNFGKRKNPLNRISLSDSVIRYRVDSINYLKDDDVYCVEEPESGTFTLSSGIITGNCAFVSTENIDKEFSKPFCFLADMSMLGIGVGFNVAGAGKIIVTQNKDDKTMALKKVVIEDSREGWVDSIKRILDYFFIGSEYPIFDYSEIRPYGTPIKTFGGVASGHEPLKTLHENIVKTLQPLIGLPITETAIVDIMNHIGVCVVAGNVRRTAEIAFGTSDEFINLKNYELNPQRGAYGWTSNNSIYAEVGQDYSNVAEITAKNGEPGYFWLENAQKYGRITDGINWRDKKASGGNPCVTGDTLVLTKEGNIPIKDLVGKNPTIWNGYQWSENINVFKTGETKELYTFTFSNGKTIRATSYHKWHTLLGIKTSNELYNEYQKEYNYLKLKSWEWNDEKLGKIEVQNSIESIVPNSLKTKEDIYCLYEPFNNTFIANGVLTGNCLEQTLETYELCNLVETYPANHEDIEDYLKTLKYAYLLAKTVSLVPTHNTDTNEVLLRNRRIGLSQSGVAQLIDTKGLNYYKELCEEGYKTVTHYDDLYSGWFKIPKSIKYTSLKPSGTVSLLAGVTPGMHFPESNCYIRRINVPKNSQLMQAVISAGYYFEDSVYDKTNYSVQIPIKIENVRTVNQVSAWEQAMLSVFIQKYWADNQVSCTVTFQPNEAKDIKHILDFIQYESKGISFLPKTEKGVYQQMPYEEITEEKYTELSKYLKPLDFSYLGEDSIGEKFCSNDTCEI